MRKYILKVSLKNTDIWRRSCVPLHHTFPELHEIIQICFGWQDEHLHHFTAGSLNICDDKNEDAYMYYKEFYYESDVGMDLILLNMKKLRYIYDFGTFWEHNVEVEDIIDEDGNVPKLIDFGGSMLKEDCENSAVLVKECADLKVDMDEINLILESVFEE